MAIPWGRGGNSCPQSPVAWWQLGTEKSLMGSQEQGPMGSLLSDFGPCLASPLFLCFRVLSWMMSGRPSPISVHLASWPLPSAGRLPRSCSQGGGLTEPDLLPSSPLPSHCCAQSWLPIPSPNAFLPYPVSHGPWVLEELDQVLAAPFSGCVILSRLYCSTSVFSSVKWDWWYLLYRVIVKICRECMWIVMCAL